SYPGSGLQRGPCSRAREPGLEAEDRLRVELRDSRLCDPEDLADLAERELLVVVESDDQLFALGQPGDRLADRLLHLRLREGALRVGRLGVLDRVDQGDLVAAAAATDRPEHVQRGDGRTGDVGERLLELVQRDPE